MIKITYIALSDPLRGSLQSAFNFNSELISAKYHRDQTWLTLVRLIPSTSHFGWELFSGPVDVGILSLMGNVNLS